MISYCEPFPTSYLLALAPTATAAAATETELVDQLARACYSGQPAGWVDCRLLTTRFTTAAWLRWACQQRHACLVLYRVPAAVARTWQRPLASTGASRLLGPTLAAAAALA